MSEPLEVAAFCGSLRKGSYNRMCLNTALAGWTRKLKAA